MKHTCTSLYCKDLLRILRFSAAVLLSYRLSAIPNSRNMLKYEVVAHNLQYSYKCTRSDPADDPCPSMGRSQFRLWSYTGRPFDFLSYC